MFPFEGFLLQAGHIREESIATQKIVEVHFTDEREDPVVTSNGGDQLVLAEL